MEVVLSAESSIGSSIVDGLLWQQELLWSFLAEILYSSRLPNFNFSVHFSPLRVQGGGGIQYTRTDIVLFPWNYTCVCTYVILCVLVVLQLLSVCGRTGCVESSAVLLTLSSLCRQVLACDYHVTSCDKPHVILLSRRIMDWRWSCMNRLQRASPSLSRPKSCLE